MSAQNSNKQQEGTGVSSSFVNSISPNTTPHLQSQSPSPQQSEYGARGQFQMSQLSAAHSQAIAQAQLKAQAQFQAQLNSQSHGAGIGGSSPTISSTNNTTTKRQPQKSQSRPPGFSSSNTGFPLKTLEVTSAARKKKPKLPDKQLCDKVMAFLPESELYTQLLSFESRVDAALARKKIDIQEAIKNLPTIQRTLRIYVFNTFANQTRTIPEKPNTEPPTWTFKIVGRILEDGVDPDQAAMFQKSTSMYPKFSSFFKRVLIYLDPGLYPDNHIITWESGRSPTPQEGFEVKRKGDREFTVHVRLEMNNMTEKYQLSQALRELLGVEVDTQPRIISAIWHYVKGRKLQDPDDPAYFHCDQHLQKVFGEEKVKFTMVSQKISQHLTSPQAIHLEHKIKLSGSSPAGNACYDVLVDVPIPIQKELNVLLANSEKSKEIDTCDEAIRTIIRKIHDHRKRRAFFLGFSQSPVEFVNALIESQRTDIRLLAGEANRSSDKEQCSEFFNQSWVEDAVIRYLNRKSAAHAPGGT